MHQESNALLIWCGEIPMLNVNICSLVYWLLLLLLRKHHSHETHQNLNHKINEAYWKNINEARKQRSRKYRTRVKDRFHLIKYLFICLNSERSVERSNMREQIKSVAADRAISTEVYYYSTFKTNSNGMIKAVIWLTKGGGCRWSNCKLAQRKNPRFAFRRRCRVTFLLQLSRSWGELCVGKVSRYLREKDSSTRVARRKTIKFLHDKYMQSKTPI